MITKLDMAKVIVQALYRLPQLPEHDNARVVRMARKPKAILELRYKIAHKIITDSVAAGTWAINK